MSFPENGLDKLCADNSGATIGVVLFVSATSNWLCVFLCVWRYLIPVTKKETSGQFLGQALLLRHTQVHCTPFGRSRFKKMQTSCENRNHRYILTTQLRVQFFTAQTILIFRSEVLSLCVEKSSKSSNIFSEIRRRGRTPSRTLSSWRK